MGKKKEDRKDRDRRSKVSKFLESMLIDFWLDC